MWLMSSEREEGTPSGSEEEEEFVNAGDTALAPEPAGEADEAVVGIPKIPDWAEELLADLAAGERIEARDQPRLTYALDLRKEYAAAVQQRKAERAAAAPHDWRQWWCHQENTGRAEGAPGSAASCTP